MRLRKVLQSDSFRHFVIVRFRLSFLIVKYDPPGRTIKVVKLATAKRPDKRPHGGSNNQRGKRDEKNQDFHEAIRAAFQVTSSELADMPMAASQGGIMPAMAKGTVLML